MTTPPGISDCLRRPGAALAVATTLWLAAGSAEAAYSDALTTQSYGVAAPERGFDNDPLGHRDAWVAQNDPSEVVAQGSRQDSREALAPGQQRTYLVSRIVLDYAEPHPDHPDLGAFSQLAVTLTAGPGGLDGRRPGRPEVRVTLSDFGLRDAQQLTPSAIRAINHVIVAAFNERGYVGVLVEPHPEDIDPRSGRDLRPPDRTELRLSIWTGRISRVRTFASGERVSLDERVDNPAHQSIKARSPLKPVGSAGPGSLMQLALVEDYVARLNRHPGRRVDVALSPAHDPGGVFLDYLVAENKPWATYAQLGDTGTKATGHARQRFGFMHTQFTGNDDILQLDYFTASFEDVNGFRASYEAPWFGSDVTRYQLVGSTASFDSEDLGLNLQDFEGHSRSAGIRFFRNIFQRGRLFADLTYGARWEYYRNENKLIPGQGGRDQFFLPELGIRAERRSETSNFFGSLGIEGNVSSIAGTDSADLSAAGGLGRTSVDEDFVLLSWDTSVSAYLEPLLNRSAWEDLSTPQSSTLAHEVAARFAGQYAFDRRLIPGHERVAGGLYSVRGYQQSLIAGDSVFLGSLEYRFHLPRVCNIGPPTKLPLVGEFRLVPEQPGGRPDWDLIFRVFVDAARVLQSDRQRFEAHATLVGVGGGVELQLRRNVTLRFDLGWALEEVTRRRPGVQPDEVLADRGDAEAHFSITTLY